MIAAGNLDSIMRQTVLWLAILAALGVGCSGPIHRGTEARTSPVGPPPAVQVTGGLGVDPSQDAAGDARYRASFMKIDEVKRQFDLGSPFFDARAKEEFDGGHVKGAVLFDPTDDSVIGATTKPEWLKNLDPKLPVVVYCNGGDCDSSRIVDAQLRQFGFTNVKIFEEGFPVWKAKGYPIEPKVNR